MDKKQDMSGGEQTEPGSEQLGVGMPTSTRRKFNAGAATGAAVLLTLGNQVSWGQTGGMCGVKGFKTKTKKMCISTNVMNSMGGSFRKDGKKHDAQRAAFDAFLDSGGVVDLAPPANPADTCAIKETIICK